YNVMNAMNTVSRFSKMHDAYTVRNVELKAEISKLKHKIQKDDHSEMIKRFSNLEVNHLNLQLKYQHLKERFGNNKSQTSQDAPEFDLFFEINKMKEQLQGKDNTIKRLKVQISHINERRSEADRILDFKALDSQNIELTENVTALQEQNERFRAENEKVKQHYKELYDSIKITRAKTIEKTSSLLTENEKLKAQLKGKMECVTMNTVKPKVLAPGVNCSTKASRSKPRSNTKTNRILPAKSDNKKKVEGHPRNNKSNLKQENRVDNNISYKRTCVVKYLKSVNAPPIKNVSSKVKQVWKATGKLFANVGYQWKPTKKKFTLGEQCPLTRYIRRNKKVKAIFTSILTTAETQTIDASVVHMTRNRLQLKNFMKKFIGIVRFRNDHFGAIMGYGDYVICDSVISMVYYVEGLGHNLFSVGQFYDLDLEVTFKKHLCYVRDVDGVKLLKGYRGSNLYTISVKDMIKSSLICLLSKASKNKSWLTPQQNGVVERRNRTLVEAAQKILIFSKALMFLWAKAVATACYTQNRSQIHTRHNKTSYELVHDKKPDLKFLRVFGALCYPTNDSEDLGKLKATADIGIFVGYAPNRKGYRIYNKRTR
ncbi:integrase, catalytic region, zinc finger, CCHC-type containing protein, partial [Tanacetum coccineum]